MKKRLFKSIVILFTVVISSCNTTNNSISSQSTDSIDVFSSTSDLDTRVVDIDENGHWYHDVSNNNEIVYGEHNFSFGFDGDNFYKKCVFCDYIVKTEINIGDVNDDYFKFYELADGTYGVGPSSLLPQHSDNKIDLALPSSHLGKPVTEVVSRAFSLDENDSFLEYNLGSIVIPSSIKTIREGAFYQTSFEIIILKDGLETIEKNAFSMTSQFLVYLPKTIKKISPIAFYKSNVERIIVDKQNEFYKSVEGVVYSKDGKTLCVFPANYYKNEYEILGGTTKIDESAFSYSNIEKVVFSSTMKEVGAHAFVECRHAKIILNDGLEVIGPGAFETSRLYDENNETIQIPDSVYEIGENAFNYGLAFTKSIILPSSLRIIESGLISNNLMLEECTIGINVTKIKKGFFLGCPMKTLHYLGKKEQWRAIELESDWNLIKKEENQYLNQIVCSDGLITL